MTIKDKKDASLSLGVLLNIIGFVLLKSISVITTPILTKLLTPADYGLIAVYNTWISVFTVFLGLQVHSAIPNARVDFEGKEYKEFLSNIMTLVIIISIIAGGIFYFFQANLGNLLELDNKLVLLIVPHVFGAFCIALFSSNYLSNKESGKNLIVNIVIVLATAILSIVLTTLATTEKYIANIFGTAIPNLIMAIAIPCFILYYGKSFFDFKYYKYALSLSVPLVFHGISHILLGQSNVLVIKRLLGEHLAGIYMFTFNIVAIIGSVWTAINQVWIPYYYDFLKEKRSIETNEHATSIKTTFLLLSVGFLFIVPEIIKVMAPQDYWSGLYIVPILLFSQFFIHLYTFPANFEFFHKKTVWIAVGTIAAGICNVILNILLIPRLALLGSAVATCLAYILLWALHEIIVKFIIKEYPLSLKKNFFNIIILAIASTIYYVSIGVWYVRWFFAIITGLIILAKIVKEKRLV